MVAAIRLVMGGGGSFVTPTSPFPTLGMTRYAGNPIIQVSAGEPNEQYDPAPFLIPGDGVYILDKGAARIYLYKSTDGETGEVFTYLNGGAGIINPATGWADSFTVDPAAVYDAGAEVCHYYFKGRGGVNAWGIGHATAPKADPTDVTLDPTNPILTSATVASDLGGTTVADLSPTAPVLIGSVVHFYGHAQVDGVFHLIHATGTTWNNPSNVESLLVAGGGAQTVVHSPSVFQIQGSYSPSYGMLYSQGAALPGFRSTRLATSLDAVTWDFSDTTDIIAPIGTGWEEDAVYAGALLKSGVSGYLTPVVDGSGRWKFYYSGLEDAVAQIGLAYLTPS